MFQISRQDAVRFLKGQQDEIRTLFASTAEARGPERRETFEHLVRLRAVHETAEEMVVSPAVRAAGDEGHRIAETRLKEEDETKKVLSDFGEARSDLDDRSTIVPAVPFGRRSNAESEGRESFPLLDQAADDEHLRRMTRR